MGWVDAQLQALGRLSRSIETPALAQILGATGLLLIKNKYHRRHEPLAIFANFEDIQGASRSSGRVQGKDPARPAALLNAIRGNDALRSQGHPHLFQEELQEESRRSRYAWSTVSLESLAAF